MPRFINIQDNFSSGEIGPLLKGRINLDMYKTGLDEMLNMFPTKQGALTRRPGSRYKGKVSHFTGMYDFPAIASQSVEDVHLFPFVVDKTELTTYSINQIVVAIVKLTNRIVIQFYKRTDGDFSAAGGVTLLSGTWLNLPSLIDYGTYKTVIPTHLDIHRFQATQYGNIMILCHESGEIAPIVIGVAQPGTPGEFICSVNYLYDFYVAGATVSNTFYNTNLSQTLLNTNIAPLLYVPYTDINSTQITISALEIVPTTSYTLTASSSLFGQGMVGSLVKLTRGSTTTTYKITGYTSPTVVSATRTNFTYGSYDPTATKLWEIQAWNSTWGHPRTVAVYEQRLIYGGSKYFQDRLWFSNTGNMFLMMQKKLAQDLTSDASGLNFYGSASASDPFAVSIASENASKISWISSGKGLYVGTEDGEYVVTGGNTGLAYNTINIKNEYNSGSSYIQAIGYDDGVIFVNKESNGINHFKYNNDNGSHLSKDLSLLIKDIDEDITDNNRLLVRDFIKILQVSKNSYFSSIDFILKPYFLDIISGTHKWSNDFKDVIIHLVMDSTTSSMGACSIVLGGTHSLQSIINFKDSYKNFISILVATKRGSDFCFEEIQRVLNDITMPGTYDYHNYLDCSYTTSLQNFTHPVLKSTTVSALVDGILYENIALDGSGNGTLPVTPVGAAIIGLPFVSRIKTLAPNLGGFGNNDGRMSRKRIDKIFVEYRNTKHLMVGTSLTNLLSLEIDTDYANNVNLYSGNKSKAIMNSSEENGQVIISTDKPYPVTILQVGIRGMTEEI